MHAKLCTQRKNDGTPCRAVAVSNSRCCRAHREALRRTRRIDRSHRPPAIRVGPLQDRDAIQRAIWRVAQGLAGYTLNMDRAGAHFDRIRTAMAILDLKQRMASQRASSEPQPGAPKHRS